MNTFKKINSLYLPKFLYSTFLAIAYLLHNSLYSSALEFGQEED